MSDFAILLAIGTITPVVTGLVAYALAVGRAKSTLLDRAREAYGALAEDLYKRLPAALDPEEFRDRVEAIERGVRGVRLEWETALSNMESIAGRVSKQHGLLMKKKKGDDESGDEMPAGLTKEQQRAWIIRTVNARERASG